jgi:hypothetical protein
METGGQRAVLWLKRKDKDENEAKTNPKTLNPQIHLLVRFQSVL